MTEIITIDISDEFYANQAKLLIGSKLSNEFVDKDTKELYESLYHQIVPGNGKMIYDTVMSLGVRNDGSGCALCCVLFFLLCIALLFKKI